MTEKFKKAVKDVVADGIVTSEEEVLILNLAKEEGISENDAKIYLAGEKKKANKKPPITQENIVNLVTVVVGATVSIIVAILTNRGNK